MILLACGGRRYDDWATLCATLDRLHAQRPVTRLIHGGAMGADRLAGRWAALHRVPTTVFFAKWNEQGRSAGHIRNARMLNEGKPDVVICFPGGTGTAHMRRISLDAGVLTLSIMTPPSTTAEP